MSVTAVSALVVLLAVAVPAVAEAQTCAFASQRGGKASFHQNSSITDDLTKRLSVRWRSGDCELLVEARGTFGVRPDLTAITAVDDGGYLQIEERERNHERRVRVTSGASGLQYRWTLDGENGFDVNRERWLSEILVAIERRTAMFAKSRVPELVRQGGANAVLDETDHMESDYARRVYYTTLMSTVRLDENAHERILRQAGAAMASDYERSEVLRSIAQQGPMTDRVTRAAIVVAQSMTSDYEKRRALSAGLASVTSAEARNALFSAASTMTSNYELAELLIAAQQRAMVDSLTRVAYFKAVDRLQSDYEHRRTLSALLRQHPESPAVLADVLRSSEDIQSDYELASLLVEFTRVTAVRGELRELYLRAARSLNSDYEYRRALQALLEQDRKT